MIHAFTTEQIWEDIEILSPNDIDNLVAHCNKEYEWDYDKDINDIICTLAEEYMYEE